MGPDYFGFGPQDMTPEGMMGDPMGSLFQSQQPMPIGGMGGGVAMPQQQQSGFARAMNSPGAAMAGSALQNLARGTNGQGAATDPMQAYQQAVQQRAAMSMKQKQLEQQQKYQEGQLGAASQRNAIDLYKQMNPKDSAGAEKLGFYMEALGLDPEDPAAMRDPRIATFLESGGVNVDVNVSGDENPLAGPAGMDTKAAKDAFRDNLTTLPKLFQIGADYKPEFMTTGGQWTQKLRGLRARIGGGEALSDEETASLKEYTNFQQGVEQQFNAYRKLITGAAGSEKELEGLRMSIFNMDQSAPEFEASLDRFQNDVARDIRGAIYLQATGKAEMGTPEMEKELNKRGATDFKSEAMTDAVGDYIANTMGFDIDNLSSEQKIQIYEQLTQMGFNPNG